jgi:chromosome segregation ATPase
MAKLDEMLRSPSKIKKSIETLREEVEYLSMKQKLLEQEATLKKRLEEIHPSKRTKAFRTIEKVLGGVQKEIRGTPAQRAKRRAKLKKAFTKIAKAIEEDKKRKESGKGFFSD